jgi:hypothetical protein
MMRKGFIVLLYVVLLLGLGVACDRFLAARAWSRSQAQTPERPAKVQVSAAVAAPAPQADTGSADSACTISGDSLVVKLVGDKGSAEWGNPGAPIQVVGYVPDTTCYDDSAAFLVDIAKTRPSLLHVRLVRMFTPEGKEIAVREQGKVRAGYTINGASTVSITRPAGTAVEVSFNGEPGDSWTLDDLKSAVEQAVAKAKR